MTICLMKTIRCICGYRSKIIEISGGAGNGSALHFLLHWRKVFLVCSMQSEGNLWNNS